MKLNERGAEMRASSSRRSRSMRTRASGRLHRLALLCSLLAVCWLQSLAICKSSSAIGETTFNNQTPPPQQQDKPESLLLAGAHNSDRRPSLVRQPRDELIVSSRSSQQPHETIQQQPANNEKPFASIVNLALVNGKVSLPCDISPASADDSVALILWYKDDSLAPIYTIDARKASGSSLDRAKTSLDEAYTNRASFNTKSKPAQLQLYPVKQDDEGDYRCRVDFKRGRTVNTIISLRVIIPPEDIRIVSPQRMNSKLEGLIGPFNEGAELTLICLVSGGKPRPSITWRRDFNVIDKTYQHLDKDGASNELKIASLNKNHLLSIFTCQASNSNLSTLSSSGGGGGGGAGGSPVLQSSITIDLNLKPQEVSLKQVGQEALVVGQTATFECVSHGSRPQATIHWLFQGSRHDTPMNADQQQTSSRITLTLQQSFNQQPLTCVAENPRIPQSSALSQTIKLDVHYPPQLSIKLEHQPQLQPQPNNLSPAAAAATPDQDQQQQQQLPNLVNGWQPQASSSYLQEGNDIYLTCQMDANPRPMKPILWRFNGKPIFQQQVSSNNMIVMNNQSLVLRKVSRHQSGQYSCDATNQHGTNSSKPMDLVIRHAPICSTDDVLIFEANIGNVINIDCGVIANPAKSVHYSWFLASALSSGLNDNDNNNNNNNNDERTNLSTLIMRDAAFDEQIDESSSRLQYKIKDENSFGLLKCKAKNAIGLQQKACLFQITKAQLPILRHGCSLANVSSTNLQVKCTLNEHLKSEDFELVAKERQPTQSASISSWLNLDAIRQQQQQPDGSVAQSAWRQAGESPIMRLVYPPNWLLAELYKSIPTNDSNESGYNLTAYIVIGSSNQLTNIKSIVEENHLFSANPRSAYYVIAKQLDPATNQTLAEQIHSKSDVLASPQSQPLVPRQISSGGRSIIEDTSIQIADSFAFTIPSLEPQTKYKLLIYGQNLANKTRDWLLVRGETKPDEAGYEYRSQIQPSASTRNIINGKDANGPGLTASNQTIASQKSIVMRSDTEQASSANEDSPTMAADDQTSTQDRPTARSNLFLMDKVQQLGVYKDYAISYARQKPLLAVPMAVSVIVALMLLLIWASSTLAHCFVLRGRRRSRRKSSLQRSSDSPSSSPSTEQISGRRTSTDKIDLRQQQLRHYNHTSPDNSSGDSSNSQQEPSNSPSKRTNTLIGGAGHPVNGASCSIYTIDGATRPYEQSLSGEYAGQSSSSMLEQQQSMQFVGSLDRRRIQHHHNVEPIYLADTGGALFQLQQNGHYHIGSIDRRTGSLIGGTRGARELQYPQPAFVLANQEMGPLEQGASICIQSDQPPGSSRCSQNVGHYNGNGSFSSTQCSSSIANQSIQVNTMIPTPRGMRQQKVAFDLSNQQDQQQQQHHGQQQLRHHHHHNQNQSPTMSVESSSDNRRLLIVSPASIGEGEDVAQYNRINHQRASRAKQGSLKGSDSGGSNSANTADSGHESPPTGDMMTNSSSNTTTDLKGQSCATRNYDQRHLVIIGAQANQALEDDACEHHGIDYYRTIEGYQQHSSHNNSMMMLMELSPNSQESSATLIQSVDSLGDHQAHIIGSRLPDSLHQMATSFTSASEVASGSRILGPNEGGQPRLRHQSPIKLWL